MTTDSLGILLFSKQTLIFQPCKLLTCTIHQLLELWGWRGGGTVCKLFNFVQVLYVLDITQTKFMIVG